MGGAIAEGYAAVGTNGGVHGTDVNGGDADRREQSLCRVVRELPYTNGEIDQQKQRQTIVAYDQSIVEAERYKAEQISSGRPKDYSNVSMGR